MFPVEMKVFVATTFTAELEITVHFLIALQKHNFIFK